jgi:hypothetical protein
MKNATNTDRIARTDRKGVVIGFSGGRYCYRYRPRTGLYRLQSVDSDRGSNMQNTLFCGPFSPVTVAAVDAVDVLGNSSAPC